MQNPIHGQDFGADLVRHHFGGGVYVKETAIPAGLVLVQHRHQHDHLSFLVSGEVEVQVDGVTQVITAPRCLTIRAGQHHGVKALRDAVWLCVHATDCEDAAHVDEVLIAPGDPAEMRAISDSMLAPKIKLIEGLRFDVSELAAELDAKPQLWDAITLRTAAPGSPHRELSDIWVRYVGPEEALLNEPRPLRWLPPAIALPAVRPIVDSLMQSMQAVELGGVLITRIPPGGTCHPHVDGGWHAKAFEKFAVQIRSAPGQAFCFDGESVSAAPGEVYWFDNAHKHWVVNPTEHERITLIVCLRREGA